MIRKGFFELEICFEAFFVGEPHGRGKKFKKFKRFKRFKRLVSKILLSRPLFLFLHVLALLALALKANSYSKKRRHPAAYY